MARKTYPAKSRDAFSDVNLGIRVDRASATVPQTATQAIFNVVGGRVVVNAIVGQVTTIFGAVGNINLVSTPSTGGAVNDMSTAVAGGSTALYSLISITGVPGDNTVIGGCGSVQTMDRPVIVQVGAIGFKTSASSTGAIKWTIAYLPLDDGAYVTAA